MIKQLQNLNTGSDAENIKLETVDLENINEMNEIFQNIIKNEEDRKLEKDYDTQETGLTIRIEDFEEKELLENDINENVTVISSTAHHHTMLLYSSRTRARSN